MKSKSSSKLHQRQEQIGIGIGDAVDPNEDTEKYDEFNTNRMIPAIARITLLSKSTQSDEGIEPDTERRKLAVTRCRCWTLLDHSSIDNRNECEEETYVAATTDGQSDPKRIRAKQKVTRCCSSDSAVLSDDEQQVKGGGGGGGGGGGWTAENSIVCDGGEIAGEENTEGRPRYWRTPSVVVSDYSDYSYLDERYERSNDPDLDKYEAAVSSETTSRASSCSCLDCDEARDFQDLSGGGGGGSGSGAGGGGCLIGGRPSPVCPHRRHSDSCCPCFVTYHVSPLAIGNNGNGPNDPTNRRNSCLGSSNPYRSRHENGSTTGTESTFKAGRRATNKCESKTSVEFLDIPPMRKISDCSTNSSLSGDDFEISELRPFEKLPVQSSGWRKLRNIVQWTPFFQTYKKQRYPWVQLAGHQGNFRAGPAPGTILKKLCPQEEACFRLLMRDVLRPYVPEFKGVLIVGESEDERNENVRETLDTTREGGETVVVKALEEETTQPKVASMVSSYLQLQDLLGDFEQPSVMDCKVGVRTYLESELAKAKERPKLRKDMYEKMIQVDPSAPNAEERRVQGVTKPRYMVWRETISSTATLGFRVEGIKHGHGGSSKDFKTTRTRQQVTEALKRFVDNYPHAVPKYLQRLKAIRATLKASPFFASHEVVGSSLLFVHDAKNAGVWMIDFAKTLPLPSHLPNIRHDAEWQVGNHEDGYLIGVNNLIDIFQDIRNSET